MDQIENTWDDLKLCDQLKDILVNQIKFKQPTQIQSEVLQYQQDKYDIIAASQTGSGKTLCFVLPILDKMLRRAQDDKDYQKENKMEALILLPTRELAIQVYKEFQKFILNNQYIKKNNIGLIVGGFSRQKQLRILGYKPKVIIATPGRLLDLIENEKHFYLNYLSMIDYLVLDEVDRIIELNQFEEITKIFNFMLVDTIRTQINAQELEDYKDLKDQIEINGQKINVFDEQQIMDSQQKLSENEIKKAKYLMTKRKTILVSATLTKISGTSRMMQNKKFKKFLKQKIKKQKGQDLHPKILDIIKKIKVNYPLKIVDLTQDLLDKSMVPKGLTLQRVKCTPEQKIFYLDYILNKKVNSGLIIIFVNSISSSKKVKNILKYLGYKVTDIHSHMRQVQRIKKLENFQQAKSNILISTDVSSRGIDIDGITTVIHYHTPRDLDTFLHRSGRTARNKHEGLSIAITDPSDHKRLTKYLNDLGKIDLLEFLPSEVFKRKKKRIVLVQQKLKGVLLVIKYGQTIRYRSR